MALTLELDVQSDIPSTDSAYVQIDALITPNQWKEWLTQWLTHMQPNLSPIDAYALGLRLTLDPEMQHFNRQFRHIDKATDVLAFASLEREGLPPEIWDSQPLELGDIIISVETAERQAPDHKHSLLQEMAWLASHGLLHLLGWDHPTSEDLADMLDQQGKLLSMVGLL